MGIGMGGIGGGGGIAIDTFTTEIFPLDTPETRLEVKVPILPPALGEGCL